MATIYGYCSREDIAKAKTRNFGEGACKHMNLSELKPITDLVSKWTL